jgi:hypothetical protein
MDARTRCRDLIGSMAPGGICSRSYPVDGRSGT